MPEDQAARDSWTMYAQWGDIIFDALERMTILAAIYAAAQVTAWYPLFGLYYAGLVALVMATNGSISLMIFKRPEEIPPLPEAQDPEQAARNLGARTPLFLLVLAIFATVAFGIQATVERLIEAAG